MLSKPESDLGSPETENLEVETESNVDAEKKPEVEKPAEK